MIGQTPLFNTSDGKGDLFSNIINGIEGDINSASGHVASDVAHAIDIHDFYSDYILGFCEGYYVPNATTGPGHPNPHKNYTHCSNRTALFHFDPTKAIEFELKPGISLTDIKWPDPIEDEVRAVQMSAKTMFVLYCIGIVITAIALVGAVLGFFAGGPISAILNFMLCIVRLTSLQSSVC
jgi:hypothetical protein